MKKLIILFLLFSSICFAQNDFLLLNRTRPLIEVFVNGKKTAMLIDTGSSMNIICSKKLERYEIDSKNVNRSVNTIYGKSNVFLISKTDIVIKDRQLFNFYSVDISGACQSIESETGIEVVGILGTPAIKELGMIIDLSRGIVTINKNSATTVSTD
jgi:hypothetical protein